LIDGSIERGTDILKALALGADAALIGRPALWALSVNGADGVESILELLKNEFEIAMKLTGCASIQEIKDLSKYLISPRLCNYE
jgi:isopentenyl diphosphate isomerase/L-lactate dehydrogenase-like FMN-dependent dehydrogenase